MKKKMIAATCALGLVIGLGASAASAGQPANPGCFGRDRAAGVQSFQGSGTPGSSEWGAEAGARGSTNGDQNRAYKVLCGG